MIRRSFSRLGQIVSHFLQHPLKVFIVSFVLVVTGLVFDGNLIRLWRLNRDSEDLTSRMKVIKSETLNLSKKIDRAREPNFIELEARERFDLANEGDLVFVFSDEE
jgi:cell division protein FtsB